MTAYASIWGSAAEEYHEYRPRYPQASIDKLIEAMELQPDDEIIEFGSGTGILTGLLADHGLRVTAIEPDKRLRDVANRTLGQHIADDRVRLVADTALEAIVSGEVSGHHKAIVMGNSRRWIDDPAGKFRNAARGLLRSRAANQSAGCIASLATVAVRDSGGGAVFDKTRVIHQKFVSDEWPELPYSFDLGPEGFGPAFQLIHFESPVVPERMSVQSYLGRLGTFGPILLLDPSTRSVMYQELRDLLTPDSASDMLKVCSAVTLNIARRID